MRKKVEPFNIKETPYDMLLPRMRKFVDYYIQTNGNASESAKLSGYKSGGTGSKLAIQLQPYIAERMEKMSNERIADSQEILEMLTRIARGEEKDAFGLDTSNQDKLRALELLGKANQLYTDRVKTDITTDINVTLVDDFYDEDSE